jgi:hypothetical protein
MTKRFTKRYNVARIAFKSHWEMLGSDIKQKNIDEN